MTRRRSRPRTYGGTGLGLTNRERLAERVGGAVGVDSVPGGGATFWLACKVGVSRGACSAPAPSCALPASTVAVAGARVLLVEDNELNREVVAALLRDSGVEVGFAESGAESLRRVQERSWQPVLMDVQMTVLDSITALLEIRERAGLQGLPIVAPTASAMPGDRERCVAAGMNDYRTRPIHPVPCCLNRRPHLGSERARPDRHLSFESGASIECTVHYAVFRRGDGVRVRGDGQGEALIGVPVTGSGSVRGPGMPTMRES